MLIRTLQITIILMAIFAINSVLSMVKADTYKKEGKESLKKNFPYLSVDKFSKTLKLDNSDGEAHGYLGIAYTSLAEKTNEVELLKKAIYEMKDARKTYEDPSINYHLAKTYELSGDIDTAIQEAVKSYGQLPSGEARDKLISLYKRKGDILLTQNKKDEAIKFYTKFVEMKGLNVTNEDFIGYEFLRSMVPDNFLVRYCLARFYMGQSLWDKAVIELEHIKKIGIYNEDIIGKLIYSYYNIGNKYNNEKKIKEAEEYLNLVVDIDSTNRFGYLFSAINILSSMYEQAGDIDKALETLIKFEGIDTHRGYGYNQIAQLFIRRSNPQKAIEYYEKYLPFRPVSDINIITTLGGLYEQIGNIDKAVEIYKKLEDINNYKGQGHYYAGLLYEKKERWFEAIKEFEHVTKIRSGDSQLLIKIGQLYERIGNDKKALELYKKVITLDPTKTTELSLSIVRLYEKMGEREKALLLLKKSSIS